MAEHRYHDRLECGCVEIGVGNDGEKRVDDLEHARLVREEDEREMIELHFHFAEQQNDDGVREELQVAIGSTGESVLDLQIETERARFEP